MDTKHLVLCYRVLLERVSLRKMVASFELRAGKVIGGTLTELHIPVMYLQVTSQATYCGVACRHLAKSHVIHNIINTQSVYIKNCLVCLRI